MGGLTVRIRAAFPVEWDREYYTIEETKKEMRAPCPCCDDTGKVTIKGDEYTCPRCGGDWRKKKVIGTTSVYYVGKWELEKVEAKRFTGPTKTRIVLTFRQKNSRENYNKSLEVQDYNFHNMVRTDYGDNTKLYDDYKAVMAEIKRLNAAEREKQG